MINDFSPIFIVGSSRSGTTMMNRVLGNHGEVAALNELHFLGNIWDTSKPLNNIPLDKAIESASVLIRHIRRGLWDSDILPSEKDIAMKLISNRESWTYRDIYQEVLQAESDFNVKFITDQTPRNVFFVDKILEVFPNAKIIHMVRDPRAVLFSQRNRWKKKWLGASSIPLRNVLRVLSNYHPYTLSKLWRKSAQIAQAHQNNTRYKVVIFEHLVVEPEHEVKEICKFLNLEFNNSMLSVPQIGSSNKKHEEKVMGISADVVDTWKTRLPRGDIYISEKLTSGLSNLFGYNEVAQSSWLLFTFGSILRFPFHVVGAIIFNPKVILVQIKALVNIK